MIFRIAIAIGLFLLKAFLVALALIFIVTLMGIAIGLRAEP